MPTHIPRRISALVLAALTLAACARKEAEPQVDSAAMAPAPPPTPAASVSSIETGKHIGADLRITDTTGTFARRDTLYVSVVSNNTMPTSMLQAKWTFQTGQVVDSTTQAVSPPAAGSTASVTEFHVVKPSGWPVGTYTVALFLDGQSVGSRQLTVK
jgi:hypothetical protein